MLGVALYCLLGACSVFVAGTGREISSPYIDKPGILTPIFRSISGVHVRIVQQFRFRSVPGFIPSCVNDSRCEFLLTGIVRHSSQFSIISVPV